MKKYFVLRKENIFFGLVNDYLTGNNKSSNILQSVIMGSPTAFVIICPNEIKNASIGKQHTSINRFNNTDL